MPTGSTRHVTTMTLTRVHAVGSESSLPRLLDDAVLMPGERHECPVALGAAPLLGIGPRAVLSLPRLLDDDALPREPHECPVTVGAAPSLGIELHWRLARWLAACRPCRTSS